MAKHSLESTKFNQELVLPFQLRLDDFRGAAQDVYDFFDDSMATPTWSSKANIRAMP